MRGYGAREIMRSSPVEPSVGKKHLDGLLLGGLPPRSGALAMLDAYSFPLACSAKFPRRSGSRTPIDLRTASRCYPSAGRWPGANRRNAVVPAAGVAIDASASRRLWGVSQVHHPR